MIFFNNQLMKNENQLRLFMVNNPVPFTRYEDHVAGIYLQLFDLVEAAIEEKENPIALIEEYLGVSYNMDNSIIEITSFLFHTGEMTSALHELKENWQGLDETLPEDSLMFGGVSQQEARGVYTETTLRTYLEALMQQNNG